MLLDILHVFRHEFGASTLVPPHNFIEEAVAARCAAQGFHLSRALMNHEVANLGLDPTSPEHRAEAKRRRPYYAAGLALVIYQTAAISVRDSSRCTPRELATSIMDIAGPAGKGVITFHWWDFLHDNGEINDAFMTFAAQVIDSCQQLGADNFATIANLSEHIAEPGKPSPQP